LGSKRISKRSESLKRKEFSKNSSNIGVLQAFSPYEGNSYGLKETNEISKIPKFLGASGGVAFHSSFWKRDVQI